MEYVIIHIAKNGNITIGQEIYEDRETAEARIQVLTKLGHKSLQVCELREALGL